MEFNSIYRSLVVALVIGCSMVFTGISQAGSVLPGDANSDGEVGLVDLDILGQHFGVESGATVSDGDFNGDGAVSLVDLDILGNNFGRTDAGVSDVPDQHPPSVPLPSSVLAGLAMLGSLGATYFVRHRKQSAIR